MRTVSGIFIYAALAVSYLLVIAIWIKGTPSESQVPGSKPLTYPDSTEPGPYILPVPSFLDRLPNSLYVRAIRPTNHASTTSTRLTEERSQQWIGALSLSSGYDSAVNDLPQASGEVLLGEGYVGLLKHEHSHDLLLQQDSQFLKSYGTGIGLAQYQRTTAALIPTDYQRTMWSVLLENGYGSDSARAVGNISPSSLSNSQLLESNPTEFSFVSGDTLTDHAVVGIHHRMSAVRTLDVQAGGYYHQFFAIRTEDQQYSGSVSIDQRTSRTQTFGLQLEAVQEHYSTLDCTTGSLNVRSVTQISESTRLEGRIGPIWGSATCAGTFDYNLTLTSMTPHGTSLYAGSAREPTNGFVVNAAWEEFTFGGFSMGNPRRLNLRLDGGYSRYVVANSSPTNPNQQGFFLSGELHHRLSDFAEISLNSRFFHRSGVSPDLNRAIFLITYRWSKEQRHNRGLDAGGQYGNE